MQQHWDNYLNQCLQCGSQPDGCVQNPEGAVAKKMAPRTTCQVTLLSEQGGEERRGENIETNKCQEKKSSPSFPCSMGAWIITAVTKTQKPCLNIEQNLSPDVDSGDTFGKLFSCNHPNVGASANSSLCDSSRSKKVPVIKPNPGPNPSPSLDTPNQQHVKVLTPHI